MLYVVTHRNTDKDTHTYTAFQNYSFAVKKFTEKGKEKTLNSWFPEKRKGRSRGMEGGWEASKLKEYKQKLTLLILI